ncbi:N-acetylmuramoyl-L-alanine amidase [Weissella coleopterorum]|uniref:N-acetylmuramoyl-L-alanine amidase n=1 Tax=Weissella coleopterorum TaxID=2714949 RepID=A0A6G8AYJ3_9LACO|nr:peptidoglycan recognition family protein [Weissella coleopterorum]QIL49953.1 N-acetylmuramoyl-L-alanine amidase [Weissella coleopterorum]
MKLTKFVGVAGITLGIGIVSNNQLISANTVNDYILGQKFPKLKRQNNINQWLNNPNWEGVNMHYRKGKPEGVVVHETANASDKYNKNAIWDEINYMLNNAGSAFVHSFVDANNAVEIANPSYMAWGSGAEGNRRFIQTESTEVGNKKDFAREIWNMANLQADYLHQFGLKPSLGGTVWSHAMVSSNLGGTDHTDPNGYWASSAGQFFNSTYTMNDYEYLLERVYQSKNAKYKVGQKVQVAAFATNEANGYDLRNHQNWVGTIKSVENSTTSNSNHAYYIDYGDGNVNMHVLEQDLKTAPAAKFKAGQKVQVSYNAGSETNGFSLKDKQGLVGTIKSLKIKNHSYSHYEYWITYSNGTRSEHVAEQDLSSQIINAKPKYNVGQKIQISSNATNEANGYDLRNHQNWIGTIKSREAKKASVSNFAYSVDYGDGSHNDHVLEQDLKTAPAAKFKTGQKVQITMNAGSETNGFSLVDKQGLVGTIKSVKIKNHSYSHYEYWITYSDGTRSEHVAEQDLSSKIINLKAKYRVGQRVQVGLNAESETNGFSLFDKRGLVGTVKSVKTKNHSYSHFEYWITYSDGTRSEHVAEQDLSNNIVPINPKYKVGQKVKIANNAVNETNGFNLMNHRGQIGTVKSSKMKNYSYSRYEYWIVYSDGTRSEHVAEQDLTNNLSKSSLAITETISSQQTTSSSSSNTNSVKSESSSFISEIKPDFKKNSESENSLSDTSKSNSDNNK